MTARVDERRRALAGLDDMAAAIAVESRSLSAKARVLEALFERPDLLIKLLQIDVDVSAAGGAAKATLSAKPSDLAVKLLAALRAGNADLLIVEQAFGHDESSSVGCGTSREPRPAESRETWPGGADGGQP